MEQCEPHAACLSHYMDCELNVRTGLAGSTLGKCHLLAPLGLSGLGKPSVPISSIPFLPHHQCMVEPDVTWGSDTEKGPLPDECRLRVSFLLLQSMSLSLNTGSWASKILIQLCIQIRKFTTMEMK
ncbi:unnamed protein product [Eretmochelys imbricata]